jgi:PiT family inorganic phosphate transporter
MILFFLTSGLFLGWSLGANDASNVFGSAVGSRMVSFRKAAIIASIAVILGAVIQGSGAADTLGKLGSVNAIGGSFTLALAAAITVYGMTKFSLPVSTTQAIVGAIIGWNFFTGNNTDSGTLSKIVMTWISGPVLGAVFSVLLYILVRRIKKISGLHLITFESFIRSGLIIVGAFGAYSLGANNIANVMGVFVPAFNLQDLDLGLFFLSSAQQLFLLGGLAIAVGILTYSKKVMETVGSSIVELSSEAAMVVVLAQSLVLFVFSSSGLSNIFVKIGLPPIPMVPVSSSQVIVGCVIGIGIYKGVRNINFRLLGEIALGWIATPVISGLLAFFSLFFVKNIFNIEVGYKTASGTAVTNTGLTAMDAEMSVIFKYMLLGIVIAGAVAIIYYFLLERKKTKDLNLLEEKFWKNMK